MFDVLEAQKRRPAMKKISTMQALSNELLKEQKLTIGVDLGDRWSFYCVLNEAGKVILEQKVATTPEAMKQPFGNNTERMQLCGLSKARPISCSDCPAFHRLQTSRFSIAENPNRCPGLMPTPPLHSRLTSNGVASTCRMHRVNRQVWLLSQSHSQNC